VPRKVIDPYDFSSVVNVSGHPGQDVESVPPQDPGRDPRPGIRRQIVTNAQASDALTDQLAAGLGHAVAKRVRTFGPSIDPTDPGDGYLRHLFGLPNVGRRPQAR
jgi:hypothetical protein